MAVYDVEWKYSPGQLVQRPQKFTHANFDERDPGLWFDLQPLKVDYQTIYDIRGGTVNTIESEKGPVFRFLAPLQFLENINHEWTEYDSVATRLAQKLMDVNKISAEVRGLANVDWMNTINDLSDVDPTRLNETINAGQRSANEIVGKIGGTRVPQVRIDSPLVYTNSPRRTYQLDFIIVAETENPKDDVLTPVRELEKYSSPGLVQGAPISIKLPYVFKIRTYPDAEVLRIDNAALTSVQPTFHQPYRKGYPTMCELSLQFTDITPIYRESIQEGGLVKVKSSRSGRTRSNIKPEVPTINPEDIG